MERRLDHNLASERGQTMAEYAVVLALVASVIAATLALMSDPIAGRFTTIANLIS